MSATTKNKYKATFILDLRESKDDSVKVMADLNEILKSIGGEPSVCEDLGMLDFARAADRRYTLKVTTSRSILRVLAMCPQP